MKAKKYLWSIICVYFCYLTHGIQAIILSQNNVNFAKQWGFNMSDPQSAAYAAGLAAVSTAVAWTGFGKFVSVWIGGEISDRVGRKKLMIGGTSSLSARGSINFPKSVTRLYFLAIFPSSMSVRLAMIKIAVAI